jgi:hypothetical protein
MHVINTLTETIYYIGLFLLSQQVNVNADYILLPKGKKYAYEITFLFMGMLPINF